MPKNKISPRLPQSSYDEDEDEDEDDLRAAVVAVRRIIAQGRRHAADDIAHMYGFRTADRMISTIEHNLLHQGGSPEE